MLPNRVTDAALLNEIEAAQEWASRERVRLEVLPPQRLVRAVFTRGCSSEQFFLQGQFDGYKELPPVWQWCDSDWSGGGNRQLSPEAAPTPYGSSIFLDNGRNAIVCTPFNRLAFSSCGGPHGDWGELSHWMSAGQGYVYAVTIADMLDVVARDFRYTSRRMG